MDDDQQPQAARCEESSQARCGIDRLLVVFLGRRLVPLLLRDDPEIEASLAEIALNPDRLLQIRLDLIELSVPALLVDRDRLFESLFGLWVRRSPRRGRRLLVAGRRFSGYALMALVACLLLAAWALSFLCE